MKSIVTSLLTVSLLLSAAMAAETGPAPTAPAGGNGQPPYSWRGINGSGVFPAQGIVTEFHDLAADVVTTMKSAKGERKLPLPGAPGSRKSIVWRTTLPHWGQNTPVAVKDRVFVLCEEGWKSDAPLLVCLDVKDGKILWQQPVDHLDAWPADKAKVAKETRAKHLRYWREAMIWWNRLFWDNANNRFFSPRPVAEFDALFAQAKQAGFDWGRRVRSERVTIDGKEVDQYQFRHSTSGRSRYYWSIGTEEMKQTYEACGKNRYHWYPGWTSEGPYFGSCMGSVVSDGNRIYAVTALDGAACYDLEGNRLWVTDLEGEVCNKGPGAHAPFYQFSIQSPVLVKDMLIYFHGFPDGVLYGLEAKSGRIVWKTKVPAGTVGTPVIMRLPVQGQTGQTTVLVTGNGMVVRVADGKALGQISFPAEWGKKLQSDDADTAVNAPDQKLAYAGSCTSWVAQGDTLYVVGLGRLIAVRLGLKGDALTHEVAWNLDAVDWRSPNLVALGQTIYAHQGKRATCVKALDAATGKILANGPTVAGYTTNLGFTRDLAVWKEGDRNGGAQDAAFQGTPATVLGHGLVTYTVVGVPDLKPRGTGYLWAENPTGEIAERHIAGLGWPRLGRNNSGLACWGNRIFIRDNDYIWCIGDPAQPFTPGEAFEVRP